MNWDRIEGNWTEFKGKVKEQWGKLTDNDLAVINGNREQLAGRLQNLYGRTRDAINREIDQFCSCQETEKGDTCATSPPRPSHTPKSPDQPMRPKERAKSM